MHKKIAIIVPFLLIWAFFGLPSCSKADKQQLAMVDSLSAMLSDAKKSMNIDPEEIEERAEEMERNMKLIRMYYKDTFSLELSRSLDTYKGAYEIYENFMVAYEPLEKELKELDMQVRNLRYSLNKGQLTEDEFLVAYNREKSDILNLRDQVIKFVIPVYDSEKFYKEVKPVVEEAAKKAEKSKPVEN